MATTKEFNVSTNAITVLNQTSAAAENMNNVFGQTRKELNDLQKQLQDMAASGQQNTEEFRKAAERAGELKSSLSSLTAEINANAGSAFEGISNNVFLFGERLTNLDLKGAGQALTGMGNAVSRINIKMLKDELGGLVKGLGNLAGAIVGNPLLALGGAVALLVLNFDKINAALSGTADKIKKLEESNIVLEKQNLILDNRINKEKILYGQSFRVLNLEKEKAKNNIQVAENELLIAQRTGDVNTIREKENKLIEMRNLLSGITAQGEADRIKLVEEAKNITIDGYKEEQDRQAAIAKFEDARQEQISVIAAKQMQLRSEIRIEELRTSDEIFKLNSKNNDLEFNSAYFNSQKILTTEKQKQLQEELNKLVEEEKILRNAKLAIATGTTIAELKAKELELQKGLNKETDKTAEELEKQLEANAIKAAKELEFEKHLADEKTRIREELALANMNAQEKELYELQKNKEKELQTWEGAEEDKVWIIERYRLLELDINKKYDEMLLEQKKDADNKDKERIKEANDFRIQSEIQLAEARWNIANASVDLLGTLFAKNKKAADVAFALEKGLAIAKVVVSNRAANAEILAKQLAFYSSSGPLALPLAAASAAPMFAANNLNAAASIAAIVASGVSKFMGGGGASLSSPSVGSGGGGGLTAPSPANFAFLGNQPNQQQPPLQAYVVSGQVSSNLEAQQLIQNQSRLGG